jgi:hypothetical protein
MKVGTYRGPRSDSAPRDRGHAASDGAPDALAHRCYDGPADQDVYNQFAFERFVYSDIASIYFRCGLWTHPRPYLDYSLENLVKTGLLIYLLDLATRSMPQYFLHTSLMMTGSALWIAALVPRFPLGRLRLFALSRSQRYTST